MRQGVLHFINILLKQGIPIASYPNLAFVGMFSLCRLLLSSTFVIVLTPTCPKMVQLQ